MARNNVERVAPLLSPPADFASVIKTWKVKMASQQPELLNGTKALVLAIEDDRTIWLSPTGNPQDLAASLLEAIEMVRKWGRWQEPGYSPPSERPRRRRGSA